MSGKSKDYELPIGKINPKDIDIGGRSYYRYKGSLTVLPCSEMVIWSVMEKV